MSKLKIFCFHRISDEFSPAYPPIPVRVFDKICKYISRKYFIVPVEDLHQLNKSTGKQYALVTFDDAYYDFYECAMPVLDKYKIPALQHVVSDSAQTGLTFWTQNLNKIIEAYYARKMDVVIPEFGKFHMNSTKDVEQTALNVYIHLLHNEYRSSILQDLSKGINHEYEHTRMLTWKELNEISKYNVSFGSHTHSHSTLNDLPDDMLYEELSKSRKMIMDNIHGTECLSLAFPNGQYNEKVVEQAKRCGYKYLFSTENMSAETLNLQNVLPRFSLYNREWWKNSIKLRLMNYK
jgi:peptidoglycan/xylan/chitin deacetylase (PgdA/CDA1 family)